MTSQPISVHDICFSYFARSKSDRTTPIVICFVMSCFVLSIDDCARIDYFARVFFFVFKPLRVAQISSGSSFALSSVVGPYDFDGIERYNTVRLYTIESQTHECQQNSQSIHKNEKKKIRPKTRSRARIQCLNTAQNVPGEIRENSTAHHRAADKPASRIPKEVLINAIGLSRCNVIRTRYFRPPYYYCKRLQ